MDFSTVDTFGMFLETGACEREGFRGSRGAERTDRFRQIFSSDVYAKYGFGCIRNFAIHARFYV